MAFVNKRTDGCKAKQMMDARTLEQMPKTSHASDGHETWMMRPHRRWRLMMQRTLLLGGTELSRVKGVTLGWQNLSTPGARFFLPALSGGTSVESSVLIRQVITLELEGHVQDLEGLLFEQGRASRPQQEHYDLGGCWRRKEPRAPFKVSGKSKGK